MLVLSVKLNTYGLIQSTFKVLQFTSDSTLLFYTKIKAQVAHCINLIFTKFTQRKYGIKKVQTTVKSRAKMVNTAFTLEFTTLCKLVWICGIYHLCL